MKKFLFLLIGLALYLSNTAFAQSGKASSLFYVTAAADYQINNGDVHFTNYDATIIGQKPERNGVLKSKNNIGGRIGFEFYHCSKAGLIVTAGIDLRLVPQNILLSYKAAENGFPNSRYSYNNSYSFTNFSADLKFSMGYSITIVPNKGAVELTTGFVLDKPFNGRQDNDQIIFGQAGSAGNNDLIFYKQSGWGSIKPYENSTKGVPINVFMHLQVAYRFLSATFLAKKNLRLGADLFGITAGDYRNSVEVTTYSANRATSTLHAYKDAMTSVGIFVSMEL